VEGCLKLLRVLPLSSHSVWGNPCSRPPATHVHTVRPSPATSATSLCHDDPDGMGGVEGVITWPRWVEGKCMFMFLLCVPPPSPFPPLHLPTLLLYSYSKPPPSLSHKPPFLQTTTGLINIFCGGGKHKSPTSQHLLPLFGMA
jgi:hypothetical protein